LKLQRYIFGILLKNFLVLVLIVTGLVFLIGMVQSLGRYEDLTLSQILERLPFVVPSALGYSAPLALLIAALMTYGRLSADNEITAIRMGGVHPLRTLMPALVLGMLVSAGTLALNAYLTPVGLARARQITKDDLRKFLDHLEASSRVEFNSENLSMKWVGVDREGWIIGPHFDLRPAPDVRIHGEARRGRITRDEDLENLTFEFEDVTFLTEDGATRGRSEYWEQIIPVENLFAASQTGTRKETLTSAELRYRSIRDPMVGRSANAGNLLKYRTEYATRVALALSCIVFVLVGAPVGMLARRGSFIGAGIVALLIVFVLYYPLHEAGKNMALEEVLRPEYAMALPGIFVGIIGLYLTFRVIRK